MGTTNIPKPEPSAIGARVAELAAAGHELYANAVTGEGGGRVRRPTLFLIAIVTIAIGSVLPAALIIALLAIAMLAYTDRVA